MQIIRIKFRSGLFILFSVVSIFILTGYSMAGATPNDDLQSILDNTPYYEPSATSSTSSGSTCSSITLTGNDNEQKAYNYFVSQGLTPVQSAGVVGNLMVESSVSPEEIEGGGDTADPSTVTGAEVGWGIAQWTPGAKVIGIAQSLNITGPIYELATQLQIVWGEMNNVSPTGAADMVKGLKQIADTADAAKYFEAYFEEGVPATDAGLGGLAVRQSDAAAVLTLYGSAGNSGGGTPSDGCDDSADCTSSGSPITGNAAIACDVLQYNTLSYSEAWHSDGSDFHNRCPTIGPSCATDCSGLVNIALYDVFGNDGNWVTGTMRTDTANFEVISFNQLKPGDFVQPDPGHVEIVESVSGNNINTFAANNDEGAITQANEVGPGITPNVPANLYLRYNGKGSSY